MTAWRVLGLGASGKLGHLWQALPGEVEDGIDVDPRAKRHTER